MSFAGAAIVIVVFLLVLSILFHHLRTGVPPVPASAAESEAVIALLREADIAAGARIYELGCGWGSLALALARAFPEATIVGIEISPLPCAVAKLRARRHPRVTIRWGDYRKHALRDAAAVTAYLMIKPMSDLATLLDRELAEGTPVVSLCFGFRDRTPAATQRLRLAGEATLYRWPAR
jgi:trans-aconitate methyltransferase